MTAQRFIEYPRENRPKWDACDLSRRSVVFALGVSFVAVATSAMPAGTEQAMARALQTQQTNIGYAVSESVVAHNVAKLRSLSGLTWDQVGYLLNTSRRTVHLWVNGNPIAPQNEERLARTLAIVDSLSRGAPALNRALLLSSDGKGKLIIDLFHDERFQDAIDAARRIGELVAADQRHALNARTWRPEYVGALDDIVIPAPPSRLAVSIKAKA